MSNQNTKNKSPYRHYVSQFYLEGFLDLKIGRLAVYEGPTKYKNPIKFRPIKNICGEPDFFKFDGVNEFLKENNLSEFIKNGVKLTGDILEEELASKLEDAAARILLIIRTTESLDHVTIGDLCVLLDWLSWTYIANPTTKMILQKRNPLGFNTSRCGGFMSWFEKVQPFFRAKSWILAKSQESLLTSDRPVVLSKIPEFPTDLKTLSTAIISIPLSPNLLLVGIPNSDRRLLVYQSLSITNEQAFGFNLQILKNANKILIARDQIVLNNFLKMAQKRWDICGLLIILKYRITFLSQKIKRSTA